MNWAAKASKMGRRWYLAVARLTPVSLLGGLVVSSAQASDSLGEIRILTASPYARPLSMQLRLWVRIGLLRNSETSFCDLCCGTYPQRVAWKVLLRGAANGRLTDDIWLSGYIFLNPWRSPNAVLQ